jgi:glutamate-1-semialdehyde aminotransferase/SAM-dependent methyltransferase
VGDVLAQMGNMDLLEEIATQHFMRVCLDLGMVEALCTSGMHRKDILSSGNVVRTQETFVDILLSDLVDAEILSEVKPSFFVSRLDTKSWKKRCGKEFILEGSIERRITDKCGKALIDVIQGKVFPRAAFDEKSMQALFDLYATSPAARLYNGMLKDYLMSILPISPVSIVEVGGGTGATSTSVLPILPKGSTYHFTDIGKGFIDAARKRFHEFKGVSYGILDIGKDPTEQGLEEESFDFVVAVNVLHATPNTHTTLNNIWKMLRPGGRVLITESTGRPRKWVNVVFGPTDEWRKMDDSPELRSIHPLLSCPSWRMVLEEEGFGNIQMFPEEENAKQHLFIGVKGEKKKKKAAPQETMAKPEKALPSVQLPSPQDVPRIESETISEHVLSLETLLRKRSPSSLIERRQLSRYATLATEEEEEDDGTCLGYLARGDQASIMDFDEVAFVDVHLCGGTMILGHTPNIVSENACTCPFADVKLIRKLCNSVSAFTGYARADAVAASSIAMSLALQTARSVSTKSKVLRIVGRGSRAGLNRIPTQHSSQMDECIVSIAKDFEIVCETIRSGSFGAVIFEIASLCVVPEEEDRSNSLQESVRIARAEGCIVILDERLSGIRFGIGGVNEAFGIFGDISVHGEGLSMGHPFGVVCIRERFVDAQRSVLNTWMYEMGTQSCLDEILPLRPSAFSASIVVNFFKSLRKSNTIHAQLHTAAQTLQSEIVAQCGDGLSWVEDCLHCVGSSVVLDVFPVDEEDVFGSLLARAFELEMALHAVRVDGFCLHLCTVHTPDNIKIVSEAVALTLSQLERFIL